MKKKLLLIGLATTALLSSLVVLVLQPLVAQAVIVDSPSNHPQQEELKAIVSKIENFAPSASNWTIDPANGYPVENPEHGTHPLLTLEEIKIVTDATIHQFTGQSVIKELTVPAQGVVFSGDWHGNLQDLVKFIQDVITSGKLLVFTGDNVDRGLYSVEVATLLLALQALYPDRIVYVRGDHEDANTNCRYGLRAECEAKYGALPPSDQGPEDLIKDKDDIYENNYLKKAHYQVFERLNIAFDHLPMASVISSAYGRKKIFAVHGGVSKDTDLNVLKHTFLPFSLNSEPQEEEDDDDDDERTQSLLIWRQLHQFVWNDMVDSRAPRGRTKDSFVCPLEDADRFCNKNRIDVTVSGHLHHGEASGFRAFETDKHRYFVCTSSAYNNVGGFLTNGNSNYSEILELDNNKKRIQRNVKLLKAAVTFANGYLENVQGVDLENVPEFIANEVPFTPAPAQPDEDGEMEKGIIIRQRKLSLEEELEGWTYPEKFDWGNTTFAKYNGPYAYCECEDEDVSLPLLPPHFSPLRDIELGNGKIIPKKYEILVLNVNLRTKTLRVVCADVKPSKFEDYDNRFGIHNDEEIFITEIPSHVLLGS